MTSPTAPGGGWTRSNPNLVASRGHSAAVTSSQSNRQSMLEPQRQPSSNLNTPPKPSQGAASSPRPPIAQTSPAMQAVLGALAAEGVTEQDIWEGNGRIYPLFDNVRDQLNQLSTGDTATAQINFGNVEGFDKLGVNSKVYRVEKNKPVWQIIALVCKKNNVTGFRRYSLATLSGYILDDNEYLSSYGFGTLLQQWELNLVRKTAEEFAQAKEHAAKGESYLVTILLPAVPAFQGVNQKINKFKDTAPVAEIIANICKRYKANPDDFSLATVDGFVFSKKEGLEYYGLGRKFDKMTVKLITTPKDDKRRTMTFNSGYAWTQVDDQLDLKEARAVITDLDKQLGFSVEKTAQLRTETEQLKTALLRLNKVKKEIEEERDHVVGQAKKLIDIYNQVKGQQEGLLVEKDQNLRSIDQLRRDIEVAQTETLAQQFEFEQQKLDLEQKLYTAQQLLQSERERLDHLTVDHKLAQDEIATNQAERTRLKDTLLRIATDLKAKKETEEQLNYDIGKLQGEIAQRKFTETQLNQKLTVLTSEKTRLSDTVETLLKDKNDLSRKLTSLQTESEQAKLKLEKDIFEATQQIQSAKQELVEAQQRSSKELDDTKQVIAQREKQLREILAASTTVQEKFKQLERDSTQERQKFQAELQKQSDELLNQRRTLEQKMASQLSQAAANKDSVQKEMSDTLTKVQKERDELAKLLAQEKASLREAENKLKSAQEEASKAETTLASSQSNKSDLEVTLKKLQDTTAAQSKELDALKQQTKALNEKKASLERDEQQLKTSLKAESAKTEALRAEVQGLRDQSARSSGSSDAASHLTAALEKEQKANIELQQRASTLEKKIKEQESKLQSMDKLLDDVRADKDKLSTDLTSAKSASTHEKDATREMQQKITLLQAEKEALQKQLEQTNQLVKETLGSRHETPSSAPPPPAPAPPKAPGPPPAAPKAPNFTSTTPAPAAKASQSSLEDQILSMKDALQKIDKTATSKKSNAGGSDMANMIISGLERRFKLVKQNEQLEDLGGDDVFLEDDDDWA